jgi:distribution and morphology protein 34
MTISQANPLNHKQPDIHLMTGSRGMLAAKQPLVVPMLLRLSHFKLSSYVVLVVSRQKGITLVFKTDPLQNVDINSTFDSISVIQKFIQREIEGQLRQMFREDLPGIIHRLSQQWVKAKVEAPYLSKRPPAIRRIPLDTMSDAEFFAQNPLGIVQPQLSRKTHSAFVSHRPRSVSGVSAAKTSSPTKSAQSPSNELQSFPHSDIENFDPTYGLRPEGLPTKSGFKGFSNLFTMNKGLADLAEELETSEGSDYGENGTSFDVVDWEDTIPKISPASSVYRDRDDQDAAMEYETVPAVGGGTITRPRIYHSQSAIQSHSSIHPASKPFSKQSQTGIRNGVPNLSRTPSTVSNPYFPDCPAGPTRLSGFHGTPSSTFPLRPRPPSPDSLESEPSRSSSGPTQTLSTVPTDPTLHDLPFHSYAPSTATVSGIYMRRPPSERRMSVTSTTSTTNINAEFLSTSPSNNHQADSMGNPKIVLRPNSNNSSIHQLSTLSHSNHTLSPYTRDLSHFTVRSVPPRNLSVAGQGIGGFASGVAGGDRQPVKARRKRTYRITGRGKEPSHDDKAQDSQPLLVPPPELDISEMDRYFSPGEFDDQQAASRMELPDNRRQSPVPSLSFPHDLSNNASTAGTIFGRNSKTSIRSS